MDLPRPAVVDLRAVGKGTRRVQLVRRDGRDVSTLYGREGGGTARGTRPSCAGGAPAAALAGGPKSVCVLPEPVCGGDDSL